MKNRLNEKAFREAIKEIQFRSENQSHKSIQKTFCNLNIIESMDNRNNQLLQGRRGTGKTHILRVLSEQMETSIQHCFYFDCRQVGSARSVNDDQLPPNHRVLRFYVIFSVPFIEIFWNTMIYLHMTLVRKNILYTKS